MLTAKQLPMGTMPVGHFGQPTNNQGDPTRSAECSQYSRADLQEHTSEDYKRRDTYG